MVTDGFIGIVLNLFGSILSVLPEVHINPSSDVYATFMDLVAGIIYLLPMGTIFIIFEIIGTLLVFRILISIPRAIWDLLPFA